MQFEGIVNIDAPRQTVWTYLTTPERVSECAPGVKSVEVLVPDKMFKATAMVALGSVSATFDTQIEWLEIVEGRYAKMKAHGNTPGSGVDVISEMRLNQRSGMTELNWRAEIIVVGQIASTASRVMGGVTKRLTAAFFSCVKSKIEL